MSNALFASDGIDLGALIAEHLGPRLLEAFLIKPGVRGGRDPADATRVLPDGAPTQLACRGFIESFSDFTVASGLALASDRKVTLLANTIPGLVKPVAGPDQDKVRIEGVTYRVHLLLDRDPSAATYVLQCRDPA